MREICFDTETTGLHTDKDDRIISIGCIELIDRVETGKTFYTLINPERKNSEDSIEITGLTDKMLKNQPKFAEIADELLKFIDDDTLIAHNANFDMNFLNMELLRMGKIPLTNAVIDTLELAKVVIKEKGKGTKTLDALAVKYGISLSEREEFHGAMIDTKILVKVYQNLLNEKAVKDYFRKQEVVEIDAEVKGVEDGMEFTLSKSQKFAVDLIERGKNVFITGAAGTGKSYLLNFLRQKYKNLHITASTGIAAINVGGQTLHSWAALGKGDLPLQKILEFLLSKPAINIRKKLQKAEMLAIDEISMISADLFNMFNTILQVIRRNDAPFGGIQLILFGDFLQLPPVNDENFCFESESWEKANIEYVELTDIYRQNDNKLIQMLNNLRFGDLQKDDIELLRYCYQRKDISTDYEPTILGTHNAQVESINNDKLAKLDTKQKTYIAKYEGKENKVEQMKKNCIARDRLTLKIDGQVMMLKNTYSKKGIMNGSIGIVKDFNKNGFPIVSFTNGEIIEIVPDTWAIEKYNEESEEVEVEAVMYQVPLILAWAITVHKSQGMTLEKIKCDLGRAFADGQIYVAISRVKSVEGLYLDSFDIKKVKANKKVIDFYKKNSSKN
ncbi:MAG: AAA family ATPase [Rickettsiales bacterium]|jgi:DNA polymerase III epsilon subunit|nr:AAA family ATPase [Rickettsiales bacterium]